jgi:hypothetical protein
VSVQVTERQLLYWNSTVHGWRLGTGLRTILVGSSSQALPLSGRVVVR